MSVADGTVDDVVIGTGCVGKDIEVLGDDVGTGTFCGGCWGAAAPPLGTSMRVTLAGGCVVACFRMSIGGMGCVGKATDGGFGDEAEMDTGKTMPGGMVDFV